MSLARAWLVALSLLVACEKVTWLPATQAIITVRSDIGAALSSLHVAVYDASGQQEGDTYTFRLSEGRALPLSFTIVPRSSATEQFLVVITGRNGSEEAIVETKAIGRFVAQRSIGLELWLLGDCIGMLCAADSTCLARAAGAAACGPVPTIQGTLVTPGQELDGAAPLDDAGNSLPDAEIDASEPDAGMDAGVDAALPPTDATMMQGEEAGADSGVTLCDGSGCEPVTGPCQGKNGGAACAGAVMHLCSATGETETTQPCGSARQCELGSATRTCAPCSPGAFNCTGARLEVCADTGLTWNLVADCPTAALCNPTAGACTDAVCTPTTRLCEGDNLRGCNATQTELVTVQACMPGMCDQAGRQCDVCIANARSCSADVRVVCDATGQTVARTACPTATPRCVGAGTCVQCNQVADCPAPGGCQVATCSSAGACGVASRPARTTCNGGLCNGSGACVQCLLASDCPAPSNPCQAATCSASGTCGVTNRAARATCPDGVCNGSGSCVQCLSDGDCAGIAGRNRCNTTTNQCVRCTATSHCNTANHEICSNNACVVGPYCGDGTVNAPAEQCDPVHPSWNKWTCNTSCRTTTAYTSCLTTGCAADEVCFTGLGFCTKSCSRATDCPVTPSGPATRVCPVERNPTGYGLCVAGECRNRFDCPPGLQCYVGDGTGLSYCVDCATGGIQCQ